MLIKVIGKPNCPYCDRAKTLLNYQQIDFTYHDLTENPSLVEQLKEQGIRTVPAIYMMGEGEPVYMGGYKELYDFIRQGGGTRGTEQVSA